VRAAFLPLNRQWLSEPCGSRQRDAKQEGGNLCDPVTQKWPAGECFGANQLAQRLSGSCGQQFDFAVPTGVKIVAGGKIEASTRKGIRGFSVRSSSVTNSGSFTGYSSSAHVLEEQAHE